MHSEPSTRREILVTVFSASYFECNVGSGHAVANLHSFLWFVKTENVFTVVRMIPRDLKNLSENMVRQSVHLLTTIQVYERSRGS